MPEWIPLTRDAHGRHGFWPRRRYDFAHAERTVPVLQVELAQLLPHYVLGFRKAGSEYQLVALLGHDQGSLYVAPGGKWLAPYVPALLRGYPFRLLPRDERQLLAIDAEHLTTDPAASPLMDDAGELTTEMQRRLEFLTQCERSRRATQAAVRKLEAAGVIAPWPLTLRLGARQARLEGLYRIDEQALNNLDAERLHTLGGGPLAIAYAQLFSTHRLDELSKRADMLEQSAPSASDGDSLFAADSDDFEFDFDS